MEIVLSIHIGNVYLYFHGVEKNNQTQVSMTTKNIIFFRLRKTGPKIYIVVNIIWPDIRRSRFFLRDSWHFGVRLFSGGSYVGKRKGLTSARAIAVTRCTGLRFTYSFLWKKRVYPDLRFFFVPVGYLIHTNLLGIWDTKFRLLARFFRVKLCKGIPALCILILNF